MRKILFLILILSFFRSNSQVLQLDKTYGREMYRLATDTLFSVPTDTFSVPAAYQSYAFIARKNLSLYFWNTSTHVWTGFSASGIDTTSLSNRINQKVNISDTSAMLLPYITDFEANAIFALAARAISTGTGLAGGGNLTADRTLRVDTSVIATKGALNKVKDSVQTNVNLKADKATTLTINGTTFDLSANRSWTVSGGTGISDSTLKWVTTNGDSTTNRLVTSDQSKSLLDSVQYLFTNGDSVASGKVWVAFGTSITQVSPPSGVTADSSYTSIAPPMLGFSLLNRGQAGKTMIQFSAGDSSFENRIYLIPTYSSTYGLLTLEGPGINDGWTGLGHPFDTATFKTSLGKWIDTALARSWPTSRVAIISSPYTTSTQYPNITSYNRAIRTVCEAKGVKYIDMYSYFQSRGGYANMSDSIHPNSAGHRLYTINIAKNFPLLKKVGFADFNGAVRIKDTLFVKNQFRTGLYSPSGTWQNILGGNTILGGTLYSGGTTNRSSARLEIEPSTNQVGVSVYEATTKVTRVYGGEIQIYDGTSSTVKYNGTQLNIGSVSGNYTVLGGSSLKVAEFGSATGVILNGDKYQGGIFQSKGTGSAYLIFATPPTDRVGIKDSVPQQTLSVRGSGKVFDSLLLTGIAANKTDTSANKPLGIDASGNVVKMSYWPGSGTSSGTGNSVYLQIDKVKDSLAWGRNDSTLKIKSLDVVASHSALNVAKTKTDSTLVYTVEADTSKLATKLYTVKVRDSVQTNVNAKLAITDTTAKWVGSSYLRKDSLIYKTGSTEYTAGKDITRNTDTITLASFVAGSAAAGDTAAFSTSAVYGAFYNNGNDTLVMTSLRIGLQGTSPSVTVKVWYNDSLNVTAGASALVTAGNAATNIYTGTAVTSFDNQKIPPGVWVWCQTSTVTTKPTFLAVTLVGYKKRNRL